MKQSATTPARTPFVEESGREANAGVRHAFAALPADTFVGGFTRALQRWPNVSAPFCLTFVKSKRSTRYAPVIVIPGMRPV